jgi:hypothetical protein
MENVFEIKRLSISHCLFLRLLSNRDISTWTSSFNSRAIHEGYFWVYKLIPGQIYLRLFQFSLSSHYSTNVPHASITSLRCTIVSDPMNTVLQPSLKLFLLAGIRLDSDKRIFKVNVIIFLFFHFHSRVRVINYQKGYKNKLTRQIQSLKRIWRDEMEVRHYLPEVRFGQVMYALM